MKIFSQTLLIIFIFAVRLFAQGEDAGVPKSKPKPSKPRVTAAPKKPIKTPSKPVPKSDVPQVSKKPTVRKSDKILYGSLQISVNERGSRIFLSNQDGNALEEEAVTVGDETAPVIIDDLRTGSYTITISKPGFFDASQQVFIAGGKVNSVSLLLKPSAAFLSVNPDTDGAVVEIENVGEFENRVENLILAPGVYQVNVFKDGFLGETRRVEINKAGQKTTVDLALKPLATERLLNDAQASFDRRDYQSTIKFCKQIFSADPNHRRANVLAGESYFNSSNPRDGAYLISRAVGAGEEFMLPVRVFKKEKNNLQLPSGSLTVSRTAIKYISPPSSDLNFYLLKTDVTELLEKVDEFGITYVSLKAKGNFGGKTEKRTVRIYADQTAVKSSRKELMCPSCSPNSCLCRSFAQAVFEIINRWQTNNFTDRQTGFGAVMLPSQNLIVYQGDGFSIKLPKNWQPLVKNNQQILASPFGGFENGQQPFNYSHGIDIFSAPNTTAADLSSLTENFVRRTIEQNPYLKRSAAATANISGTTAFVNKLSGLSPVSQRSEEITIYTMTVPSNQNFMVISTVTPPDENADYKNSFRRILNSLNFLRSF